MDAKKQMIREWIFVLLLIGSFSSLVANVTLSASSASRDWQWVSESWMDGSYMIHAEGTTYTITTAKMYWNFKGTAGTYRLKLKVYAKPNGPAPIWVKVNGKTVWSGETPRPVGCEVFPRCCGGSSHDRDCDKEPGAEGAAWIDTKKDIIIPAGAKIEFYGKTAYHCQSSTWEDGTVAMGWGGGTYAGIYEILLVGPSVTIPSITLASDLIKFDVNTGATNIGAKSMSITNGGGGTLPKLSVSDNADWLKVSVSGSGNTQTVSNSLNDISGITPGTYTATVTVSGSGISDKTYKVSLIVTNVPDVTVLSPNGGEIFAVGDTMRIKWSSNKALVNNADLALLSDAGLVSLVINQSASVKISDSNWGNYKWIIPALLNGKKTTGNENKVQIGQYPSMEPSDVSDEYFTIVSASDLDLKFNAGGSAVGSWRDASKYVKDGTVYTFRGTQKVVVTTAKNPAPESVYHTCMASGPEFLFDFVPNGTYLVRLHFADPYTKYNRKMKINIEGKSVLENYDLTTVAGGSYKANIQEFKVKVEDNNGLFIAITDGGGEGAFVNGIEIKSAQETSVVGFNKHYKNEIVDKSFNVSYHYGIDNKLLIGLKNEGLTHLEIFNVLGKQIFSSQVHGPASIPVNVDVSFGLLFLRVSNATGMRTLKVVSH